MNTQDIFDICLAKKVSGGGSPTPPTPTYEDKTLTPDFSNGDVIVNPDEGYDALSSVTITKDSDLVAENIKKDVEVFGITGSLESDTRFKDLVEGTLTEINDSDVTEIDNYAFYSDSHLISVKFLNVTSIDPNAFYSCTKLTLIDFPSAISIATNAFYHCSNLTSVNVPNVTSVGNSAFSGCSKLTSIDLNAISIEISAFSGCSKLTSIVLRKDSVCTLSSTTAFSSTPFASGKSGGTLYVPQNLIASYQADTNWSTVLGWNANNKILAIEGSIYE